MMCFMYVFSAPMPEKFKKIRGAKPKGVANRNRGLKWIRQNAAEGVLYFADDDNTYDVRLFNEVSIICIVELFLSIMFF